jgi:mannose-6-phosphate isomerase-like protein (cupin superfamily)
LSNAAATPVSKATANSFVWREVCEGWTLVDAPGLHVIQERMPAHTFELSHVHEVTHQLYFVLEGHATVVSEADRFSLAAGDAIEIPPGVPHQMRNDADLDLEFLVVSSQRPREDRFDLDLDARV